MALGNPQIAQDLYDFAVTVQKKSLLKPEYATEIAKLNPMELGSISMLLTVLGAEMTPRAIGAQSIRTIERGPVYAPYTIRTQPVATGAGNNVTVIVSDATTTAPFETPVRVHEVLERQDNGRQIQVISITAVASGSTTFLARPLSATDDWAATPLPPGSKLTRLGQIMGDPSHGVETLSSDLDSYEFFRSQLRESFNITGDALTQGQLWVNEQAFVLDMMDYAPIWMEQKDRHRLLAQPDMTNLAANSPITNMNYQPIGACGLIPAINGDMLFPAYTNGHPGGLTINIGAGLQLSNFLQFSRAQKALANNCKNYVLAGGAEIGRQFADLIIARGGTVDAWDVMKTAAGIDLDTKFQTLRYDGFTYSFVEIDAFNTPLALGGPGSRFNNYAILIPADKFVPSYTSSARIPRFGVFNGGATRNRYWTTGSIYPDTYVRQNDGTFTIDKTLTAGWGRGSTDVDRMGFEMLTEMGYMYYDLSYFGQFKP